jgi:mannosyltransferase
MILIAIILLGAGLRFYNIGKQPLWLDEAFSVWLGKQSLADIVRVTVDVDTSPPLHYFMLHYWIALGGDGEVWTRTLSALVSILTIPAIFFTGKLLASAEVGLISALIFAVSPFQVAYGQEARMYAPMALFGGLSLWMTAYLLTDERAHTQVIGSQLKAYLFTRGPRQPLYCITTDLAWLGYMVFTALTVFSHTTGIFLPLAVNIFVLGLILFRRFFPGREGNLHAPMLRNWIIAQIGLFLLYLPWLPSFYKQSQGVIAQFWIPKPTAKIVGDTLKSLLMDYLPTRLAWGNWVWAGFGAAFFLSIFYFRRKQAQFIFLAVLFFIPLVAEIAISNWRPIFADRTLIWTTLPLYILVAAGISQLRYRSFVLTATLVLFTIALLSLNYFFTYVEKERWDQAAAYVAKSVQPGDLVIYNAGWVQIPFDYYYRRTGAAPIEEIGMPATLFERGILEPHMAVSDLPHLREVIQNRQRVWLVYSHNWWTDPQSLIPSEMRKYLRLEATRRFYGIQVQLYTKDK